jgi:large subunit ribosomal protein L21
MYAVIKSGGKQYKVTEGQLIKLEKLPAEIGGSVDFPVLMVADGDKITAGAPYVTAHKVSAEVVSHGRGKKVKIIKMRRRKHFRKQMGHRQSFTEVKITKIA